MQALVDFHGGKDFHPLDKLNECIARLTTRMEPSQQNLHSACVESFLQGSESVFLPAWSNVQYRVSLLATGSHKSESQEHRLLAMKPRSTLWLQNLFSTFPPHDELDRRVSWRRDESLMETFVVCRMLLFVVLETFMKKMKKKNLRM